MLASLTSRHMRPTPGIRQAGFRKAPRLDQLSAAASAAGFRAIGLQPKLREIAAPVSHVHPRLPLPAIDAILRVSKAILVVAPLRCRRRRGIRGVATEPT